MLLGLKRFSLLCYLYFGEKNPIARAALTLEDTLSLSAFTELMAQAGNCLLNAVLKNRLSLWWTEPVGKQS
jgi:hypothetical protein